MLILANILLSNLLILKYLYQRWPKKNSVSIVLYTAYSIKLVADLFSDKSTQSSNSTQISMPKHCPTNANAEASKSTVDLNATLNSYEIVAYRNVICLKC